MSDRNLTDADVQAIVATLKEQTGHTCRFDNIRGEDLGAAIDFYKNFNKIVSEGKSTARKTLVVITVTSAVGMTVAGAIVKFKDAILSKVP